MNKLFDKNITLDRESHTYSLATNPDLEFISATTFVGQFFEKFEAEKIAKRLVASSPKYMGMSVEEVLASWKNSADHGTLVHEELENHILNQSELIEPKAIQGIRWLNKFRMKADFDIFTEVMIYSEELKLSGTIDLLLFDKSCKQYIIMDWKTSKKIDTKSYGNKKGILPASSNIEDTKFNHYALQLSLYRYILETYYGLEISQHLIIHLKDNKCTGLHAPYMKNIINKMVQTLGE
jgi:ATP-dependent exoDNAse (exonuclease V) beta subunit